MKRIAWIVAACAIGAQALAANSKPDAKRLAAIWSVVNSRMSHQTDVWFSGGDFSSCVNLLRFMARTNPSDFNMVSNLGWILENTDQPDAALAEYIRYDKDNPKTPYGPYPAAYFYFYHRAFAKVPPLLEPTLAMHPDPNNYRLLAHAYDRLGMFPDSVRVWQALIAVRPQDGTAKKNLAEVQRKMGGAAPAKK